MNCFSIANSTFSKARIIKALFKKRKRFYLFVHEMQMIGLKKIKKNIFKNYVYLRDKTGIKTTTVYSEPCIKTFVNLMILFCYKQK